MMEERSKQVSPGDLERIIRRAAELQLESGSDSAESALADADLLRIGEEVGLERRHVRQAIAEAQAGLLIPSAPEDAGLPERLWGAGFVRATRVIPGDRDLVEARIVEHFREREALKCLRTRPGRSLWEPARGLVSTMRRGIDVGGHGYELAKARNVEVAVEQLEPGRSLVTLTVDARNQRNAIAAGWHGGLGSVGAVLGLVPFVAGSSAVLAVGVLLALIAASLGAASSATSAQFRRRRERIETAVQGLLDRLEHGEALASDRPAWRERIPPFS